MKVLVSILMFALTAMVSVSEARDLTSEEKLSDLNQLVSRLKSGYGPLQYKKKNLGIDIDVLAQKYSATMTATKTNGEFYYQMMRFIAEFKDGHFSANLPTTYKASLPFTVDLIQGKVLIDEINRATLPVEKFVYQRGDEIIEFNGRPVVDEIQDLMAYVPNGNEKSVRRLATMSLTIRSGVRFPVPTSKAVQLKIRRGESSIVDTLSLDWTYEGEANDEISKPASFAFLPPRKIFPI